MKFNNRDEYTVVPFTKERAEELGHIAWIEETDPVKAIARMKDAVEIEPVNCAVWIDPSNKIQKETIGNWRRHGEFYLSDNENFHNICAVDQKIRGTIPFSHLADYVSNRFHQIFNSIAFKEASFQIHAGPCDFTKDNMTEHADGYLDSRYSIRFLESIECARTIIFANKDTIERQPGNYGSKYDVPITVYEVPEDSLILITQVNDPHPWQPIVHSEAIRKPGENVEKRTVITYECMFE